MKKENKKKFYKIVSISLLVVMFLFMCFDAAKQSFWLDELDWTIDFIANNSFFEMIKQLLEKGYNLPLYYLVMFPIYKIVPYGELFLLLPNIIVTLIGVILTKKIGDKIFGEDKGFPALVLAATSYILVYQCAFELRPYAFLYCLSAWVLYNFIKRQTDNTLKNNIIYTISLILLAYTHWFGCLIIVFYFLVEAYRFLKKELNLKFILPYIALGISFLPWFISMMLMHTVNLSDYFAALPTIDGVKTIFTYLLGDNLLLIGLFVFGIILFLISLTNKKLKYNFNLKVLVGSIIWTITTIFIYSRFINPSGSLFVNRYFLVVLPHIFILASLPLILLLNLKVKTGSKALELEINDIKVDYKISLVIISILIVTLGVQNYYKVHKEVNTYWQPYREISNLLVSDKDIHKQDSAVVTSVGDGYLAYYFEKRNYKLPENVFEWGSVINQSVKDGKRIKPKGIELEDLLKYNKLYLYSVAHTEFYITFWDFVHENYEEVENHPELGYSVYKKK